MATINFYIRKEKANKKGIAPVILKIVDNYNQFRKTVIKIPLNRWDDEKFTIKLPPKSDKDFESYVIMKDLLEQIERNAQQLFTKILLEKRVFTEDDFQNLFPDNKEKTESYSFFEVLDLFIETNKPIKAERTIKGYISFKNYLIDFQEKTKYKVEWNSLNLRFIDQLQDFTFTKKKHEDSYYARIINIMKAFLNWAFERSYYTGNLQTSINHEEPEKPIIFLTKEELFIFYYFDFLSLRLNKARDLFCFAAFTGLRYSDVAQIKREHIRDGFIYKTQQKTKEVKTVPLSKFALEVLNKYKESESPLPIISSQKLNDYLKECCKIMTESDEGLKSFGDKVAIKSSVGGMVTETYIPKYEAITFHVARKTFLTNSIMMGMSIPVLQEMGAPKRDKDLKKYIKITDAFKKSCMEDTWNKE